MKKLLLSIAALLLGLLAHSQEADDFGSYAEVTFIPRLDVNPYLNPGSESGINFGNSSFYTLFEGSVSEHFSWTVANHWLHVSDGTKWLYDNIGRSDSTNFLDILTLDFNYDNWTLTFGKDMITTGGFEFDEWDWDIYTGFATPLWNGLSSYQWGAKLAWENDAENTTLSLQMTSSPYGEHPFSSGLWAYSGQWTGEYGPYSAIASFSAFQAGYNDFDKLFSLGQKLSYDDWAFTLDWSTMAGFNDEWRLSAGNYFFGKLDYYFSDKFNVQLRGGYVSACTKTTLPSYWNLGSVLEFYPIEDSDELRLHAYVSYDSLSASTAFCIGARYNLNLKLW